MHLPDFELHEPATLRDAAALLVRHGLDARLLAGGTDVLVDLKTGRVNAHHVISIRAIEELRGVEATDEGLWIGALTTLSELDRSPSLTGGWAAIRDATREMAAHQIRNLATVGGNVACAVPCADLPPIFMVMSASAALWSPRGERTVALEEFYMDARRTVLRVDELLTGVVASRAQDGFGAAYARFAPREGNAIAVAAVAAGLTLDANHSVCEARICLGAVAPTPRLVEDAAVQLVGRPLDEDGLAAAAEAAMRAAEPISDVRGSADFRRELVEILTRRALVTAARRAKGTIS